MLSPDALPDPSILRPGWLLEIADGTAAETPFAGDASALYVPVCVGDTISSIVVFFNRERTGPFTPKQHRLAFGITHAFAVALENDRLIAELRAANRTKAEFLSTMSHELRTPLNVISGYAGMLADSELGALTSEQRFFLDRIRESARDQLDLINSTIDLNRLEAGMDAPSVVPVDLDALFAEIRADIRATKDAVTLRWQNRLGARTVETDATKLRTIVRNLVDNALKFTEAGEVEVTAAESDGHVAIAVRDTGVGIAAEDIPIIFDVFRQVDGSETRRFGGAGLGLYLAKCLAERLDATISVVSTPGVGSTFTLHLPSPA
jgi:signal transduction histidine kinase